MRTLVDIPDDKLSALDALAARRQWSRAEAVRQGVDRLLAEEQAQLDAVLDSVCGSWAAQGGDAVALQRAMRDDWDGRAPQATDAR